MEQDCFKLTGYYRGRWIDDLITGNAVSAPLGAGEIPANVVLLGAGRFGLRPRLPGGLFARRADRSLRVAEMVVLGSRPPIDAAFGRSRSPDELRLVTLKRARLLSEDIDPAGSLDADEAIKMTIYFSRQDRVYQVPAFEVICEVLRRRGIPGATAVAGIDKIPGARGVAALPCGANGTAPMMVISVGSGTQLGLILPELGGLLRHPLITLEQVDVCKRDGRLVCVPPATPSADAGGNALRQRLTVYACGAARHDGSSIHRAIVRRLHSAGTTVATLRGVCGFRGDHVPGGGRHSPVVTVVTASTARMPAVFAVVDELTASRGLVTSEVVTVVRGADGHP